MNLQYTTLACLLSAIISAAVTDAYFPKIKTVEVEKEVIKNNIVTVTHTVQGRDGTVDITTTTTDKSQKVETDTKTQIVNLQPNWLISGTYETDIHTLQPSYGVQVNRRILGPVFLSAGLNTKGAVGLGLGFEF